MKKIVTLITIITFALVLFACAEETPENEFETISITDVDGTREVKMNPIRVAVFTLDIVDILDYVGIENTSIQKFALPKSNLPESLSKFSSNVYTNVGTLFEPDYDALDLFNPQLIIIGRRTQTIKDDLSEAYPNANLLDATLEDGKYLEGMTRNVENLASIFPGIATALAVKFESLITKIDSIQVVSQAYKAMFLLVNAGDISFYGPAGRYAMLYNEFGFDAADDNTSEGGSHGNVVTYEYVTTKNPEIIFLLDRGAAIGEEVTLDDVKNNAAIMATSAGQNQRVYELSPSAWYLLTGGFTSTEVMISDFDEFIISHTE